MRPLLRSRCIQRAVLSAAFLVSVQGTELWPDHQREGLAARVGPFHRRHNLRPTGLRPCSRHRCLGTQWEHRRAGLRSPRGGRPSAHARRVRHRSRNKAFLGSQPHSVSCFERLGYERGPV